MKKDMTKGGIWKLIIMFALPIMAANLLQQMYNTVDNVVVGNFAEAGMPGSFAAVATTAPLSMLFLALSMGLGTGAAVVCSQLFGARREKDLAIAVDTAMILMTVVGIVVMVIGLITTPVLLSGLLSVKDPEIHRLATAYMRIFCIGIPFTFLYNAIASALRGVGDSKASLFFLLITSVINIVLDLWFVISFNWGVQGVSIATVIAQVICTVVSYVYLRRKFRFQKGEPHFDKGLCTSIVKIGLPSAIQMCIVSVGNSAMMRLVHHFAVTYPAGNAIIDAFGAGSRIDFFVHVPSMGLQSALASFTGQNIAANRIDRVKRGYYVTLLTSFVIAVGLSLVLYFFAVPILKIFGLAENAISIGTEQIIFYSKVFWIFALYNIVGGVLQGAGDTIMQSGATLLALFSRVAIAYAGVYLFGWYGYEASWATLVYAWGIALTITNIRFFTGGWKKKAIARRAPEDELGEPDGVPALAEASAEGKRG